MEDESFYIVHGELDRHADLMRLHGNLTEGACRQLAEAIREAIAARKRAVTLDFTGVPSITGGGLFPLYTAATRARNGRLRLFAIGLDQTKLNALQASRLDAGMILVTDLSSAQMMCRQG